MLVLAAWIAALPLLPPRVLYWVEVRQVERHVAQLEQYKRDHGHYPDEEKQAIVPRHESGNPYFYRGGGAGYELGFSIGFDDTHVFSSVDRQWSFDRAER